MNTNTRMIVTMPIHVLRDVEKILAEIDHNTGTCSDCGARRDQGQAHRHDCRWVNAIWGFRSAVADGNWVRGS
jgi:hypothetical protein